MASAHLLRTRPSRSTPATLPAGPACTGWGHRRGGGWGGGGPRGAGTPTCRAHGGGSLALAGTAAATPALQPFGCLAGSPEHRVGSAAGPRGRVSAWTPRANAAGAEGPGRARGAGRDPAGLARPGQGPGPRRRLGPHPTRALRGRPPASSRDSATAWAARHLRPRCCGPGPGAEAAPGVPPSMRTRDRARCPGPAQERPREARRGLPALPAAGPALLAPAAPWRPRDPREPGRRGSARPGVAKTESAALGRSGLREARGRLGREAAALSSGWR
ncbi:uncharacterized protein LOC110347085 [Heterocephalus glaber]|uniref:Uncharacterized protein LOC110347085 n=1 Tax=Heterocephalus glaber TaxID=10181 RepID=A0AAX6S943_HETGA|nr:uncharacterized protein LOC110347085 [Heterocephalus glaber]XP_021105438.1 uncharacterized protein LOC110347085 [Heterocephalus glaber]